MSEAPCSRARAWVSLRLDDELSAFESLLLAAHLERCEACRAFELGTVAFTAALRRAALDAPPTTIALSQRRSPRLAPLRGAAAAVAACAVLAGLAGSAGSRQATSLSQLPSLGGFVAENVDTAHVRRGNLLAQLDRAWVPRRGLRFSQI